MVLLIKLNWVNDKCKNNILGWNFKFKTNSIFAIFILMFTSTKCLLNNGKKKI